MLTVTSYYVAQGFASLLWEPLADSLGRRPVYIYSFLLYISANIVLSFSPNFAILAVFRAIQAFSIASTVSMGRIVMYDISLPSEHVRFYAFSQAIRNYTIIVAPIIGGLLAKYMSFRSIFVFLLGLSITALLLLLFFLPETHRIIAGNGTWSLKGIHQPLIWRLKIFGKPAYADERQLAGTIASIEARVFIKPLMLLREKDILLSLLFSGVIFGIWSMVTISTAGLFQSVFGLNEAFLGLVFIPSGSFFRPSSHSRRQLDHAKP
jgi:MFS family permease